MNISRHNVAVTLMRAIVREKDPIESMRLLLLIPPDYLRMLEADGLLLLKRWTWEPAILLTQTRLISDELTMPPMGAAWSAGPTSERGPPRK